MIILRKQGRQYDKLGRNCVVLGIIASGFAIGMDYVNNTYDIPMIEDYLNPDGMFDILDWFGGTSIYVFPPIVIMYWIIDPKLRSISVEYEKKEKDYLLQLEEIQKWEKDK